MSLIIGATVILLAGCGRAGGRQATPAGSPLGPNLVTLHFKSPSGAGSDLHVRVEATEANRERGLMGVTKLPQDEGDLFAWPEVPPNVTIQSPFWMKDTPLPLSIAFISGDGKVQEVQDMQAETLTYHVPAQPYRYAVEANQGWFANHELAAGATVNLPAALAPLHLVTATPLSIPTPPPPPTFPPSAATPSP